MDDRWCIKYTALYRIQLSNADILKLSNLIMYITQNRGIFRVFSFLIHDIRWRRNVNEETEVRQQEDLSTTRKAKNRNILKNIILSQDIGSKIGSFLGNNPVGHTGFLTRGATDKGAAAVTLMGTNRNARFFYPELQPDVGTENRAVTLAAVRGSGWNLKHASPKWQNDKEVVMAAVLSVGDAIRFASPELQNDPEVCRAAVTNIDQRSSSVRSAFEHCGAIPKRSRDVTLAAVRSNWGALQFASATFQNDEEIVMAAVTQDLRAIKYASRDQQGNKKIAKYIIKKSPDFSTLQEKLDDENLKNDKEFILFLVEEINPEFLRWASENIKINPQFLRRVLVSLTQNFFLRLVVLILDHI